MTLYHVIRPDVFLGRVQARCKFGGLRAILPKSLGVAETQEMLDFYAHHNITADVEVVLSIGLTGSWIGDAARPSATRVPLATAEQVLELYREW